MSGDFVETVRIENVGCVRDARVELTRLRALIGPNDSGKSTVLGALRTAGELIRLGETELVRSGRRDPRGVRDSRITMSWDATEVACVRLPNWKILAGRTGDLDQYDQSLATPFLDDVARPARGATLVR